MSTDVRPKCLGEAMLSRRSCNDKVCHWCWEQKNLHNCPEWDIPSAPPSLSLLLSLFLVSLQDQVQLNLRFLARTSRFTVQWKHFFHSLPAEEKRMSRGFQMRPHLPVKNLLNCLTVQLLVAMYLADGTAFTNSRTSHAQLSHSLWQSLKDCQSSAFDCNVFSFYLHFTSHSQNDLHIPVDWAIMLK